MTQLAKHFTFSIALVSFMALPVFAQSRGDIRITTASEVAVPGHLLEPGSYWFRRAMADDPSVYKLSETRDASSSLSKSFRLVAEAVRTPRSM